MIINSSVLSNFNGKGIKQNGSERHSYPIPCTQSGEKIGQTVLLCCRTLGVLLSFSVVTLRALYKYINDFFGNIYEEMLKTTFSGSENSNLVHWLSLSEIPNLIFL